MDSPYQGGPDVHVLPTNLALPGVGVLSVNAYVVLAEEPVLIDTGIGLDGDQFIEALASIVDPAALRWVWLTHDDADHIGSIRQVLERAPHARLVTNAFCAFRMATWWPVPFDRVHAIRVGDAIHVGDRTLRAVAPPLFDNPLSIGVLDESTGALFSVDAFGAILPEPTQDVAAVPPDAPRRRDAGLGHVRRPVGSSGRPGAVRRGAPTGSSSPAQPHLLVPPSRCQRLVAGPVPAGARDGARRRAVRPARPRAVRAPGGRPERRGPGGAAEVARAATRLYR